MGVPMKRNLIILVLLLIPAAVLAQGVVYTSPVAIVVPTPSGFCTNGSGYPILVDAQTGGVYWCNNGQISGPLGIGSGITQLTGDVTAGPGTGSQPATLATVNGSPGTCGDADNVCRVNLWCK